MFRFKFNCVLQTSTPSLTQSTTIPDPSDHFKPLSAACGGTASWQGLNGVK